MSKELVVCILVHNIYIRPHLEYCVPIWSPYLVRNIEVLEKVQKQATKLVKGYEILPYDQRLKSFYTLFCSRQRGDLIVVFKILNGHYDINPSQFFTPSNVTSTRGNCMKLYSSHIQN